MLLSKNIFYHSRMAVSPQRAKASKQNTNEACPAGPCTQYSRTLVPNTMNGMVFGTRDLKRYLDPLGWMSSSKGTEAVSENVREILKGLL